MTEQAVTIPPMPLFAYEITDDMKAEFVELIADGYNPSVAAAKVGTTGSAMKKHYSGNSKQYYDPVFGAAVKAILKGDDREERLEALVQEYQWAAAERGHWPAIEKLSLVYDRRWEKLRHQNFHHDHQHRMVLQYFEPDEVERAVARAEAAELGVKPDLKLLEAGNDESA